MRKIIIYIFVELLYNRYIRNDKGKNMNNEISYNMKDEEADELAKKAREDYDRDFGDLI